MSDWRSSPPRSLPWTHPIFCITSHIPWKDTLYCNKPLQWNLTLLEWDILEIRDWVLFTLVWYGWCLLHKHCHLLSVYYVPRCLYNAHSPSQLSYKVGNIVFILQMEKKNLLELKAACPSSPREWVAELGFESKMLLHLLHRQCCRGVCSASSWRQHGPHGRPSQLGCGAAKVQSLAPPPSWEKEITKRGKEFDLHGAHSPLER